MPDRATTELYTLSLHDALPICSIAASRCLSGRGRRGGGRASSSCVRERHHGIVENRVKACAHERLPQSRGRRQARSSALRSEEHTSELQSPCNLVCRLLLEKKK